MEKLRSAAAAAQNRGAEVFDKLKNRDNRQNSFQSQSTSRPVVVKVPRRPADASSSGGSNSGQADLIQEQAKILQDIQKKNRASGARSGSFNNPSDVDRQLFAEQERILKDIKRNNPGREHRPASGSGRPQQQQREPSVVDLDDPAVIAEQLRLMSELERQRGGGRGSANGNNTGSGPEPPDFIVEEQRRAFEQLEMQKKQKQRPDLKRGNSGNNLRRQASDHALAIAHPPPSPPRGDQQGAVASAAPSTPNTPNVIAFSPVSATPRPATPLSQEQFLNRPAPEGVWSQPSVGTRYEFDLDSKNWVETEVKVMIDSVPFSKGNIRNAFRMWDLSRPEGTRYTVAKESIMQCDSDAYWRDVQTQAVARRYAEFYNGFNPPKHVEFLEAWVLILPNNRILSCEPFISGTYMKHSNNSGYVDARYDRNTPQAFSHFTWHYSKGRLMVVDIQGVDDFYTDPQIHTADGKGYGKGNLGMTGVERYFRTHLCNELCKFLKLNSVQYKESDMGTVPRLQHQQ